MRDPVHWSHAWALLCLLVAVAGSAAAQRTLNHGLHAVPAPKKVVVDGDLSEWDRSGEIVCCKDVERMLDSESVRVAAMWDAANVYFAFVFRDATPMVNKVDPATMVGNGWRSDCVQFRCNMAGFVSHIDAWYYSTGKKPAMTIKYGRHGVQGGGQPKVDRPVYPAQLDAEQAFRMAPDQRGYVQEIKIPWAVLTLDGKTPPPDADLRVGIEMFWGDADARSWPRSRVTDNLAEGQTQTDFFWTNVKAWGPLIRESKNHISLPTPAWKLAKKPEPKGLVPITFTVPRDSRVTIAIEDAAGNRVKSLLGGVPFKRGTHTVAWSGLDDRNNPVSPGRYSWKGIYRDPIDIRWKMSFYQPNAVCPWGNADGTGAWGPDHGNLLVATAGGGLVFLGGLGAEAGFPLLAVDEKGRKAWTGRGVGEPDRLAYADGILYGYTSRGDSNWLGITPRGVMHFDARTGKWLDITGPDGKPTRRLVLLGETEVAAGFAADAAGLYIAVKDRSVIRSFDRTTFKLQREIPVPGAGEILATGKGTLLAATPKGLLEVHTASGKVKTVVEGDFAAAQALATDGKGTVYVAWDAPLHQVHAYRNGAKALEIGRRGGRTQNGWYDPTEGFLKPSGLAVDSQGQLWVVENTQRPKRVSVWKDGRWLRDFIGDTGYGGGGVINPLDPSMAFYRDMQFRIDLEKGTWTLKQLGMVIPKGAEKCGLVAPHGDHATGSDVDAEYMMAYKGRAYVHTCRGARRIYRELPDKRWALCVFIDPQKKLAWIDRNDDCTVQDDEVVRGGADDDWGSTDYWGMRPSQGLDLYFTRGVQKPGLRLRLQGVTKGGTPLYDLAKFEPMAGECQNGIGLRDGSYNSGCAGERGDYFSEMRRIHPAGTPTRTFWFRGENTGRWTFRLPEPGIVLYPFQAHGIADVPAIQGEVVCWVSDFGQRYLFTGDMLYVDQLFMDARTNYEPWPDRPTHGFVANAMAPGQESFHGYFTRLADGRTILTTGFTDCRVFEVTGLDSLRRIAGATEVKAEHLARAREIRQFRLSGGKGRGTAAVRPAPKPVTVDGKLDEWPREGALEITVDKARGAKVHTARDAAHLYVAWDVRDASPMRNKASRPELAFKGGDAVDMMFRQPGPKLDDPGVRAGDLRLLLTVLDGTLRTVLYRPVSATRKPYTFDAFEGAGRGNAVKMDEVRLADEVKARMTRGKSGYVVEAAIPWSLLGGAPKSGAEGRIDFGVLFSDPAGARTALRAYWENRDTNIVSDIPSEARLQPANWGQSRFVD